VGDQLRAVVAADVLGRDTAGRDEALQERNGVLGGDRARHLARQRLAGELVDHVQHPQLTPVGCFVALEVERPDVVGAFGAQLLGTCIAAQPGALSLALRHSQPLIAPETLHALLVHFPALFEQAGVGTAVTPALLEIGDLAQPLAQSRVIWGDLRFMALRRSVLAGDPARPALGEAEPPLQHADGSALPGRA
jgi:hypothetical protein